MNRHMLFRSRVGDRGDLTRDILVSSAGLAIVALFAVTWISAVIYWRAANVEARYQPVERAE